MKLLPLAHAKVGFVRVVDVLHLDLTFDRIHEFPRAELGMRCSDVGDRSVHVGNSGCSEFEVAVASGLVNAIKL